jgi:hypothetical protein
MQPTNRSDPQLVCQMATLACSFDPDRSLLDQPGRASFCLAYRAADQTWRYRSVPALESAIREFIVQNNGAPKPFVWTFRKSLRKDGITPVIPGRANCKKSIRHDKEAYKGRNVIEIDQS